MIKVGFIGAGNMGAALAGAVYKKGCVTLSVSDKDERKADELATALGAKKSDNITIAKECDYIFLGVKPNIIKAVAEEIREVLKGRDGCTVISMAAGVSISSLEECLGNIAIIRIMPNTPVSVGHGVIIWSANKGVSDAKKAEFATLLSSSGLLDEISE